MKLPTDPQHMAIHLAVLHAALNVVITTDSRLGFAVTQQLSRAPERMLATTATDDQIRLVEAVLMDLLTPPAMRQGPSGTNQA